MFLLTSSPYRFKVVSKPIWKFWVPISQVSSFDCSVWFVNVSTLLLSGIKEKKNDVIYYFAFCVFVASEPILKVNSRCCSACLSVCSGRPPKHSVMCRLLEDYWNSWALRNAWPSEWPHLVITRLKRVYLSVTLICNVHVLFLSGILSDRCETSHSGGRCFRRRTSDADCWTPSLN